MGKNSRNVKMDINFLDKPLYFQKVRTAGKVFTWTDIDGYIYKSSSSPPDHIDMLILLYMLFVSQERDYIQHLKLKRYEILKACSLGTSKQYYERLETAIERWASVTIHFKKSFYYDRNKRDQSEYFHILSGIINHDGDVEICFDEHWINKIRDSCYLKFINFGYYKLLKRPITRRLYEILCKSFKGRNIWPIHLTRLGYKLPIAKRVLESGKETMYASDVLNDIKPAIREINSAAFNGEIEKVTGIKMNELFTITYNLEGSGNDRIIYFHRHPVKGRKSAPAATEKAKPTEAEAEVQKWLEAVPGFHQAQIVNILEIPDVLDLYPQIRSHYEREVAMGKTIGPGYVYSAFTQRWKFDDVKPEPMPLEEFAPKKEDSVQKTPSNKPIHPDQVERICTASTHYDGNEIKQWASGFVTFWEIEHRDIYWKGIDLAKFERRMVAGMRDESE